MITILAPYGRNEVTSAAIRLTDLVIGLGHDVRLIAGGSYEKTVHPHWDSRVICDKQKNSVSKAASKSTTVVHFACNRTWHEQATLADTSSRRVKQILVPNWHSLGAEDEDMLTVFDQIVCPSKACRQVIKADIFDGDRVGRDKLSWCRWDAGVPPVRREGTVEDGKIRACLYCDAAVVDYCGPMTIQLAHCLLGAYPKLELSVLALKSWSKHDRSDLRKLATQWGSRLRISRLCGLFDLTKEYHAHDWAILPGIRSDFGMAASRALSCGTPVICHDVSPFSELINHDNGVLVPCDIWHSPAKAPLAVPDLGRWLKACEAAFKDSRTLFRLQTLDWKLAETQAAFNNTWRAALAL